MKRNQLFFSIMAIFLVMICLSSVSAVDDSQFDSTLKTADDSSQVDYLVIDEINDVSDDTGMDDSIVDSLDVKENLNPQASLDDGSINVADQEKDVKSNDSILLGAAKGSNSLTAVNANSEYEKKKMFKLSLIPTMVWKIP